MRFVYADEAGTSKSDQFTVVAAVLIHADSQWRMAETEIARVIGKHVPPAQREGYVFHAADVYSGSRKMLCRECRMFFLLDFLCIPRRLGLPICVGTSGPPPDEALADPEVARRVSEIRLLNAWAKCLGEVDQYMREKTPPNDVATLVCEDGAGANLVMREFFKRRQRRPLLFDEASILRVSSQNAEQVKHDEYKIAVTKIVDEPHFLKKGGSPMLQLADVCAYAIRRFLHESEHGDLLLRAMTTAEVPAAVAEIWRSKREAGMTFLPAGG